MTFTISLVVIPATSGVPVPGAKAGSRTSISIDKYKGLFPTLSLILLTILSIPILLIIYKQFSDDKSLEQKTLSVNNIRWMK